MKRFCMLMVLLLLVVSSNAAVQIPTDIPYGQDVEDWWSEHIFNPESPNYDPDIISPANQVTLNSGDSINTAINNLPSTGGTIILNPGTYSSFSIIKRKNIHIIAPDGATITGYSEADGTDMNYADFVVAIRVNHDPAAVDDFLNKKTSNIYIKGVTFDGQNVNTVGFQTDCSEGVLIENCIFQNHKRYDANPAWGNHFGVTGGEMGTNNIWYRGCTFKANGLTKPGNAIYCDGIHTGGVLNCTIESGFTGGGLLYLVNDDYTFDHNNDGVFSQEDVRKTEYLVVYGSTFGTTGGSAIDYGARMSAANCLFMNNTAVVNFNYGFVKVNPKTSLIYPNNKYYFFGNKAIGNSILGAPTLLRADNNEDYCPPTQNNKGQVGHFTVKGNTSTSTSINFFQEVGLVEAPNIVCGNCKGGETCTPNSNCDGDDSVAPSVPGQPILNEVTHSSVSFHWTASTDNVAVAGYLIYRDGDYYASVSNTNYTDEFCSYNTEYSYQVAAYDLTGNISGLSDILDVTTEFPPPNPDLSGDCFINLKDFAILSNYWLFSGLSDGDVNFDQIVNLVDVNIMSLSWLDDNMLNLIVNGSFESDKANWGGPYGGGLGEVNTDPLNSYSGNNSFNCIGSSTYGYLDQGFSDTATYNLEPNKTYTIRAMIKMVNPMGGEGILFRFVQLNPSTQIYSTSWYEYDTAGQWVEVEYSFTTPTDYVSGRFDVLWDHTSGDIYVDDVKLEICPNAN